MKQSEIIARLILSTKRKKRDFSIAEIANDISSLKEILGNLNEVSKVIGISVGMLNQFLSVYKLPIEVQSLIKKREIDSVAIVFLLSKFPKEDTSQLTQEVLNGKVSSQELKILLPYRKQHPNENILTLLENINLSKNIQISVIKLPITITKHSKEEVFKILKSEIGDDSFLSVTEDENSYLIKIKKNEEKILRDLAKKKKITLSAFITTLIT